MHTQILNVIDISNKSLAIAGIIFILVTFIVKYIMDSYNTEDNEVSNFYYLYSIIIGIVCAFLSLVAFKQISKFSNSTDILTGPFPSSQR